MLEGSRRWREGGPAGAPIPALSRSAILTPAKPRPFSQTRIETRPSDLKLSRAPLDGIPTSDFFPLNFTNAVSVLPNHRRLRPRLKQRVELQ